MDLLFPVYIFYWHGIIYWKKNHFPIIADILNTKSSLILHKHKIANDIDNSATF